MLLGAPAPSQVTAEDKAYVDTLHGQINTQIGQQHNSFEVVSVSNQVVAGTNKFLHIVGKPENDRYTITVHIPPQHTGDAPSVTEVSRGHHELKIGHSEHSLPVGHPDNKH